MTISTYKSAIETTVAGFGMLTAILYVTGFVADRVHWNLFGLVDAPADHLQFLYRGGVVVLAVVGATLRFFLGVGLLRSVAWWLSLGGVIALLCSAFLRAKRSRWANWLLGGAGVLFAFASVEVLRSSVLVSHELLFEGGAASSPDVRSASFGRFVGIVVAWLAFLPVAARLPLVRPRWIAMVLLVSVVLLPVVYGGYQYPWTYPVAEVFLGKETSESLSTRVPAHHLFAVLFDTGEDLALYDASSKDVLRIKKSNLEALVIHCNADITRFPLASTEVCQ